MASGADGGTRDRMDRGGAPPVKMGRTGRRRRARDSSPSAVRVSGRRDRFDRRVPGGAIRGRNRHRHVRFALPDEAPPRMDLALTLGSAPIVAAKRFWLLNDM